MQRRNLPRAVRNLINGAADWLVSSGHGKQTGEETVITVLSPRIVKLTRNLYLEVH